MRKRSFFFIVSVSTLVFFLSWFVPHEIGINKLAIQSEDTLPAIFIPISILKEGHIFLDSYYDMLVARYPHPDDKKQELELVPYYLRKTAEGHFVSAFPIVTPLLALPVYLVPVLAGMPVNWENVTLLAGLSSSLIMSLSGGFLYLLLKRHFFEEDNTEIPLWKQKSFLLTLIYLFATINYAHISQALWQHGTVQLFTILALLALYEKRYFFMGFSFGLMILSRPTSGIAVVILGLLVLINGRKGFASYFGKIFLGLLPPILFFLWYNSTFYGTIANQGYSSQIFTEWQGRFPEGFLGLWLSPSKGILVYSPIFFFSLVGIYLSVKNWRKNIDCIAFALIVIFHTLVLGKWKHWYGGWSFGYRMASDILPFLVLLLVPYIKSSLFCRYKKVFFCFFGISVLCQFMGLIFYDGIWHAAYDKGFVNTSWLWSIKNSELAFNIRRILVKAGLRASPFAM